MLSKENYDKLNENYLYEREAFKTGISDDYYWCKNWTFKIKKYEDGRVYMVDTYWGDSQDSLTFEVTDENIDKFKFIFDFREVERVPDSDIYDYEEEDLYRVPTNSGGRSCGKLYWKNKNTKKSNRLQIENKLYEIKQLENKLKWAREDLERLKNNDIN
ncbi:hypothetical protein [uncultured Clostridium sp.]|uniref:hypothetical protein n=1 Tax=uncultured Clostridium sp. TaxID=59620 RepID=UPI003216F07A